MQDISRFFRNNKVSILCFMLAIAGISVTIAACGKAKEQPKEANQPFEKSIGREDLIVISYDESGFKPQVAEEWTMEAAMMISVGLYEEIGRAHV